MEPKQAVLESKIDYVKIGINGTLEVVCAHKYGYYEQVMTQLACSEQKSATLIIWRLFISFYLPEDEFERLSSRSSFFSSVVSSMLVTVSAFSEMFESSCFSCVL
jgi:hypothetical protein